MDHDQARIVIADILRSRGNKGEVAARSQTDVPGRIENLTSATIRLKDGSDLLVEVESSWQHKGEWILKFSGVNGITEAERFAGAEIWLPAAERGQLPDGDYFQNDLIGCVVTDGETGLKIGPVTSLENYGASPLLEVDYQGRSVLIPMVNSICRVIDLPNKKIVAELPEGLLDL